MKIIPYYKLWFLISAILIIPGIIALAAWKLNLGIDFKGGTITTVQIGETKDKKVNSLIIEESLTDLKLKGITVQPSNNNQYIIRAASTGDKLDQDITSTINKKIGESKLISFESIGPSVSSDLTRKAFLAVLLASIAIIFYVSYAFRKLPKPANSWRFGVCAVLALIHDVLFVVGIFAILGHFFNYEVNGLFVTALLTIMGFSVHDTIVVFDRIRENLRLSPSTPFAQTANDSVVQTLGRSLNTSITVLVVLLAMYLMGGESIKQFTLTLLIGITIGTYSSIFNASPLLVVWQNIVERRNTHGKAK